MTDYGHDIEKYLKGELTAAERHALEKKALSDPFLADALEGAEQIKAGDFIKDVAQLNERLQGKKTTVWMWTARIAAGVAILLVSTFIIWSVMETAPPQDLAMEKNEKAAAPAPPATSDSATSATQTLSSPPVEQPTAGPAARDKDVAKQPAPIKTETKPQIASGAAQTKNEPITDAIAISEAEEKADELKTEPIAPAKSLAKETEVARAKAEDDVSERSKKKTIASDREVAPSAADRKAGAASSLQQRVVRGQVTSAEDGSALPGVNVIIKGTTLGTATDANGNYELAVPANQETLNYSFIGMQTKDLIISESKNTDVQLELDMTQLSEVVVTAQGIERQSRSLGYSVSKEDDERVPTIDLAHPEIGNRAFKQYLEKNIRYPEQAKTNKVDGRVTVEFTIEPNGSLTNFTIIRGIGSGCDEELIRLIKEGPKWVPTKKDNVPVQDKAKVRLKFELPK